MRESEVFSKITIFLTLYESYESSLVPVLFVTLHPLFLRLIP
jgi:hypothetical protein